ncbi:MAG: (Fe-S)-binding protein [Elusimicrobia bacterium]|nr:(Fe-S)-binding protein [Elusimicrobiota bacterium]
MEKAKAAAKEAPLAPEKVKETVVEAVKAIKAGPRALTMYMEMCAKCGTCAAVCPVYYGKSDKRYNPVLRSDRIRRIYKKYCTALGKAFGSLAGAEDFDAADIKEWVAEFYECTGCRRCATFCPFGIDNSVITRKGRAIIDKLGLTPATMKRVVDISLKTGNTDNASPEAFKEAINFLKEEMAEEHGTKIDIPIDKKGAEYFYVPPSGDVLVNPEATMGIAKIFHVLAMTDQWTMSSTCFDGANYGLFTGNDTDMKNENKRYVDEAKRLGVKTLLMGECGHAHRVMKMMMEKAKWWGQLPFEITNCMQWTADHIRRGRLKFDKSKNPQPVTYHDPCNFARSCGITEEPREIMAASCADFREMYPNRAENWCCGGGAGLSAMDDLREFRMTVSGVKKLEQIRETGAKYVAAACSNCKRQLTQLMEHYKEDIEVGGVHDMLSRAIIIGGKAANRKDYKK